MSQDRIRQLQLELEQKQIKLDEQSRAEIQEWCNNSDNIREYIRTYKSHEILHFDGILDGKIRFATELEIYKHAPYYMTYDVYVYIPFDHPVLQTHDQTHIKHIVISGVIEELKWTYVNFIRNGYRYF